MINAVGREIPDEILEITGKEGFQGNFYMDDKPITKIGPTIRPIMNNQKSKLVANIREALIKCEAHDGMTVSFHHHFDVGAVDHRHFFFQSRRTCVVGGFRWQSSVCLQRRDSRQHASFVRIW